VFYRGFDGTLDSAIAIRVVLVEKGTAYIQSGAGIVADSDPEAELRETLGKAGASLAALDRAEELG
jgi:anthranilate synthase component 1